MLIEKRDGAVTVPKQSMVSSRNMEICRRWGVAKDVRSAVWPESHPRDFVYLESLRGRELLRVKQPAYSQRELHESYTPDAPCPCPQIYFDPGRAGEELCECHIELQHKGRFVCARPRWRHRYLADMTTLDTRTVRARYLVGCDGPAGFIRQSLGIELDGVGIVAHSLNLFFRSAELATSHDRAGRVSIASSTRPAVGPNFPIDGKELWRLTVFDKPASLEDPDFLLRKMLGGPFAYEMLNVSPWERHDFVAQHYGRDHVFIAGDAAHECSPTGGIGMHTGLEEAVNLGWKLSAIIEGWGGPRLLPSYELERRPIAARNVGFATRSFRAIASIPGWQGAPAHGRPIPHAGSRSENISSCNIATSIRRSAYPMAARRQRRNHRDSCHRPVPAAARRMPGSPTAAQRSTCSAGALSSCGLDRCRSIRAR